MTRFPLLGVSDSGFRRAYCPRRHSPGENGWNYIIGKENSLLTEVKKSNPCGSQSQLRGLKDHMGAYYGSVHGTAVIPVVGRFQLFDLS